MPLTPGTKLGPYEIIAPLGAGGMGEVYQARDSRLDRDVAIKVLPQSVAGDAERLARFQREAKALAAVNHPNIAQVFGLEDGPSSTSAIVMELIDGDDLSAIITRGPIAVHDAIPIARQIAEALEAAHEQGIVHRDLKPGNIRVRADGTVKVLDFGLAKAIDNAQSAGSSLAPTITTPAMTHAGVVLGTAAYMSPEQAKGKVVDRRTDIWSFGAVFYEMLTATRAFPGDDVTDAIASIVAREPEWTRLPAETPHAIRTLLQRCVVKDVRRRLRDIGEARLLLDDVAAGRTPAATEAAPAPSRTWIAFAAATVAIVIASLAGFAAWTSRPADPAAPVVRFAITLPRDYLFVRASTRLIALSPDASHLVHVGNRQLYLRALSELESRPIQGTNIDPTDPFFSPDGQWVGFFSISDARLRKVAITGGAPVELANFGKSTVGAFQGGVWTGDEILFASQGKGIMRLAASGGEPELLIPVEQGRSYGPQPLPGGDAVLFSRTTDSGSDRWDKAEIVVYSRRTREATVVLRGGTAIGYLASGHLVYAFGSSILAVPFDLSSLEVTGPPVTLVENVRRVVDQASGAAQFVFSQSGTAAHIRDSGGITDGNTLALIDAKGNATSLGFAPNYFGPPRVSPDGKQLAVGAVNDQSGTTGAVWVAELTPGATLRRLTFEGRNLSPMWSADSRWIYFVSGSAGPPTLFRQLADGSGTAERIGSWPGLVRAEAQTPDGRGLIVATGTDILVVDSSGAAKPLLSHPGLKRAFSLSRDGRWFAYSLTQGPNTNVFVEPFPPTGVRHQITTTGGASPLWSPDGRRLFYNPQPATVGGSPSRTLVAVDIKTTPTFSFGPPTPVPVGPGVFTSPRNFDVTPDGRYFLMTLPVASAAPARDAASEEIMVILNWIEELRRRVPTQ